MLVHKRTMAVLEFAPWDGRTRAEGEKRVPVLAHATLEGLGLSRSEWWEVPAGSAVGQLLRRCYPWCDAVVEDGELVGVTPWKSWRVYGEAPPAEVQQLRRRRQQGLSRRRKPPILHETM